MSLPCTVYEILQDIGYKPSIWT